MENGSLKDHLLTPVRTPLSWQTRIQIVIDVANALEYFHFYCNPPPCHRDIKSSNILLDENFVAKWTSGMLNFVFSNLWDYVNPFLPICSMQHEDPMNPFGILLPWLIKGC